MSMRPRSRAGWDTYFLDIAKQAATRSSCALDKHGAVIVSKRRIRSTGYNGTPSGFGHCDQGACPRGRKGDLSKPCWGLHAEANAVLYAGPEERDGSTVYITAPPCTDCAKLIANSGIREVVAYRRDTPDLDKVRKFLLDCKVRFRLLDEEVRPSAD